jgi:hypothetical protein
MTQAPRCLRQGQVRTVILRFEKLPDRIPSFPWQSAGQGTDVTPRLGRLPGGGAPSPARSGRLPSRRRGSLLEPADGARAPCSLPRRPPGLARRGPRRAPSQVGPSPITRAGGEHLGERGGPVQVERPTARGPHGPTGPHRSERRMEPPPPLGRGGRDDRRTIDLGARPRGDQPQRHPGAVPGMRWDQPRVRNRRRAHELLLRRLRLLLAPRTWLGPPHRPLHLPGLPIPAPLPRQSPTPPATPRGRRRAWRPATWPP